MTASNEREPGTEWPALLDRYVGTVTPCPPEYKPRRVRRRFHGIEDMFWQGYVHVDDVQGYVENIRLKFFLNRWRARRRDPALCPTSSEIYEIMLEADREETQMSKKPFHVERIAENIARNGVQEPIIVYSGGAGAAELWDGNRRFYGTRHVMRCDDFRDARDQAQWLPAIVVTPTGDPARDERLKHAVLTEMNFIEKDFIPWPAYVKAEQIFRKYEAATADDPANPELRRIVKARLASEYGLRTWRQADRWIKMYELAMQFKEYEEEDRSQAPTDVDLKIQEKFEYFDEMSKPGVWGAIRDDPDAREEVFSWLWDEKFKSFVDVRSVPKILADPVARRQANAEDTDGVKRAIATVIANDPTRYKDKEAANEKIKQFGAWLDSFKRGDFRELDLASLESLKVILEDVVKILTGLLADVPKATSNGDT